MAPRWMLIRGLIRGNGHWGVFPELLKKSGAEIELIEIPGNGTWNAEDSPTNAMKVIELIKERSSLYQSREPFHICGISLGGMIALKWAEQYPKDLLSISLVNTSLKQCSPFYKRLLPKNYGKFACALFRSDAYFLENLVLTLTSNHAENREKYLAPFTEFSRQYPISRRNFFNQLRLAQSIVIRMNVKTPVTVINSKYDHLVDPTCSEAIAKLLQAKLVTHPTAGHDLPLDDPEWLCAALTASHTNEIRG